MPSASAPARGKAVRRVPAVVLLLLLAVAAPLLAHGALRRATPAAGARVPSPAELRLEFSEVAELTGTHVALTGAGGAEVPLGALRHPAPDSQRVVIAPVPDRLEPGRYTVAWQLTGRDGHPVRGRYAFTVVASAESPAASDRSVRAAPPVAGASDSAGAGGPPQQHDTAGSADHRHQESAADTLNPPTPTAFDTESPAYVALRWLSYVILVAGIGAVTMARIASSAGSTSARRAVVARLAAIGLAAGWIAIVLVFARLVAQSAAVHGLGSALQPTLLGPMVGQSTWGHAWVVQLLASIVATVGFTMALPAPERPAGWRVAEAGALLAAVGTALGGHGSAAEGWQWGVLVGADALHVLAAGAWIGGVMMLALAVLPRTSAPDGANVVRSFSPWALGGAGTIAATGIVAALSHLQHPLAPWTTRYGRILLLKLALVALIMLLGAVNWRRLGPRASRADGSASLRRSVWLEAAVAIGVLGVTAVLVAVSPLE